MELGYFISLYQLFSANVCHLTDTKFKILWPVTWAIRG